MDKSSHQLDISISPDNTKKSAKIPTYIPSMCSLRYALTNCIDIRSSPRKVKEKKRKTNIKIDLFE
jgi:hypothetical protein